MLQHESILQDSNSASATYLFQKDKFYDTKWDVGDKYLQCGRRADVLKLWTMWIGKVMCASSPISILLNRPLLSGLYTFNLGFYLNEKDWLIPSSLQNGKINKKNNIYDCNTFHRGLNSHSQAMMECPGLKFIL